MTPPTGVPLDFFMYEGKGTPESALIPMPAKLDRGGLSDTLPLGVSIFTDRYVTSIPLTDFLRSRQITLVGTIMANRLPKKTTLLADNELTKKEEDFMIN